MKIDWGSVNKILVVRLRSIGDTVVATPALQLLREHRPDAKIDIVLEDWVAPVLDGFELLDDVILLPKDLSGRVRVANQLRKQNYDIAFNLHGGTTAGFLVWASRAKYRIGYKGFQYEFLYSDAFPAAAEFWKRDKLHSAEHQTALLGFTGLPVESCPKTRLFVTPDADRTSSEKLRSAFGGSIPENFGLIHPGAAYDTKRWAPEKFSKIADYLAEQGIPAVVVATAAELPIAKSVSEHATSPVAIISNATLPEITAIAAKARVFVGNDSGIAHIAGAVGTPTVVIFGSSNINHWRPWTDAPNAVANIVLDCQPCPGDRCRVFGEPKCIIDISVDEVIATLGKVLAVKQI